MMIIHVLHDLVGPTTEIFNRRTLLPVHQIKNDAWTRNLRTSCLKWHDNHIMMSRSNERALFNYMIFEKLIHHHSHHQRYGQLKGMSLWFDFSNDFQIAILDSMGTTSVVDITSSSLTLFYTLSLTTAFRAQTTYHQVLDEN
jgi:hypothetical protein